jgi:hypothetical protein
MSNPYYKQHWIDIEPERHAAYDQILGYHPALEPIIRPLELKPGLRVLDVGSGPAYTTMELARRVAPLGQVSGVDINAEFIARSTERAREAKLPIEFTQSAFCPPQKLSAWLETCKIVTNLKGVKRQPRKLDRDRILSALVEPVRRFTPLPVSRVTIQKLARGRESVPAQTDRFLPGTQNQAPPDLLSNAIDPYVAQPPVRLEKRVDGRDAQNFHWLAPQGLRAVLAQEMPIRPATDSA